MPIYDSYGREKITTTGYELPLKFVSTTGSINYIPGPDGRTLFQVTGAVQIYAFVGHVLTDFLGSEAVSGTFVSRNGISTEFSDSTTFDSSTIIAGTFFDLINGFNPTTFGHAHVRPNEVKVDYCPQGVIKFCSTNVYSCDLKFYMIYRPLTTGSYIVPVA